MREAAKWLAHMLATVAVTPWLLSYVTRRLFFGSNRAFEGSSQALALLPGMMGSYLRRAFLVRVLTSCERTVTVEFGVLFSDTALVQSQAAAAAEDINLSERPVPAGLAATGTFLGRTPQEFAASWAFILEPLDGGQTRLIERFRVRFDGAAPAFRLIGPVMGFGVFVMVRRQLLGIRERAELTAVAPPFERPEIKSTEVKPTEVKPVPAPANGRALEVTRKSEVVAVGA